VRCKDMMTGVAVGEYLLDGVRKDRHGEMVQKKERERAREDRVLDDEAAKRQGGKSTKAGNSSTIPNGIGKLKGCDWA
jgi:hypothetical protein